MHKNVHIEFQDHKVISATSKQPIADTRLPIDG